LCALPKSKREMVLMSPLKQYFNLVLQLEHLTTVQTKNRLIRSFDRSHLKARRVEFFV